MFDSQHWVEVRERALDYCQNSATWIEADEKQARKILAMLADCDPELDTILPVRPNLSGEWADDPTPLSLARDILGEDDPNVEDIDAIADVFEAMVDESFERCIENELLGRFPLDEPVNQ